MQFCAPAPPCGAAARVPGYGAAPLSFPLRGPSPQRNTLSSTEAGQHGVVPVRVVCRAVSAVPETVLCDVHLVHGAMRTLVKETKGREKHGGAMVSEICGLRSPTRNWNVKGPVMLSKDLLTADVRGPHVSSTMQGTQHGSVTPLLGVTILYRPFNPLLASCNWQS